MREPVLLKHYHIMNAAAACAFAFFIVAGSGVPRAEAREKKRWVKSPHGLQALMSLSSSRGKMVRELDQETENYKKILEAVVKGDIKKGLSAEQVSDTFGPPVVKVSDAGNDLEKWVYKPGSVSHFSGKKIDLYFKGKELVRWDAPKIVVRQEKQGKISFGTSSEESERPRRMRERGPGPPGL